MLVIVFEFIWYELDEVKCATMQHLYIVIVSLTLMTVCVVLCGYQFGWGYKVHQVQICIFVKVLLVLTRLKIYTFLGQIGMLYTWIDEHCKWKTQLNVHAVIMIWICQTRCIAKILYAKSRIDKIPYANIPTDKIPYAENALCRNSNCPNALQPF